VSVTARNVAAGFLRKGMAGAELLHGLAGTTPRTPKVPAARWL
jgi:hypothetical protein